ncbi:MAG: protein phosphatase 2C domain-containing protein [Clostridiales Family XIII bacterium]|jgi:protein phosphatase|nr:protein phosphatase 2C domain-containing protein [Clostridiales Family XIII bacterium]
MLSFGYKTDVGKIRSNNEDALLVLPAKGVFAVFDGVGGASSGEIASRAAVNSLQDFLEKNPMDKADEFEETYRDNWLEGYFLRCFRKMNTEILSIVAREPVTKGMATTAVLGVFYGDMLHIVNVGDSRAYLYKELNIGVHATDSDICKLGQVVAQSSEDEIDPNVLIQITEDHTWVNSLINMGELTKEEAANHPKKNMITKALGADGECEPDFYHIPYHGERILLCSDGLNGEVDAEGIREILSLKKEELGIVADYLVEAALAAGGGDNVTVVVFEK